MQNKTRFKKGSVPWNKGLKGIHLSPATEFPKGFLPKTHWKKGHKTWNKGKPMPKGEKAHHWKGGKLTGLYIRIYSPSHPFKSAIGYVYEHRLVMEKHMKRFLKPTEHVHHRNGDKHNNHIENLQYFPNNKSHIQFHADLNKKALRLYGAT